MGVRAPSIIMMSVMVSLLAGQGRAFSPKSYSPASSVWMSHRIKRLAPDRGTKSAWRQASLLPKHAGEMRGVAQTDGVADLGNGEVGASQQRLGFINATLLQVAAHGYPRCRLESARQSAGADIEFFR